MKKLSKKELIKDFTHKQYGFFKDASVQICEWNKKAVRGEGVCYKQDFYGADTISCHQIAPTTFWCNNSCTFCWRPNEHMGTKPPFEVQNTKPSELIEGLISARKKLLTGFKGYSKVSKENFENSQKTKHWAISLSGEPTLYKNLPKLIKELKNRKETETVFLVSNGQNPNMIKKLVKENSLPTQLYISMVGPNKKLTKALLAILKKWVEKLLNHPIITKKLNTRTVIRLTVIKGLNDKEELIKEFTSMLEKTQSDFIEIKSYMWLGLSRERLKKENMSSFKEIKEFMNKFLEFTPSYKFENEKENSRIVLLKNKKSKYKTKIIDRD